MVIRNIRRNDLPELAKLYRQFWNEESDIFKMEKQFDSIASAGTHILLGAEENESLIGTVMGIICQELYGNCQPFIVVENMIVDIEYRRKGVGNALLQKLERFWAARR